MITATMNPSPTNNLETEKAILAEEQRILDEEKKILNEEQVLAKKIDRDARFVAAAILLAVIAAAGGLVYWRVVSSRVYAEKAEIAAPSIDLAPQTSGQLQEIYVRVGDSIKANAPVALIGDELIKAKGDGEIIAVRQDIGKLFNRGEAVATMIDPNELRVVTRVEEDKGLRDIRVGQMAIFEADAFGAKRYTGTVDEISPTSRDTSAVFSISDKREMKEYDVKIRFDAAAYPELKNGMSAKVWISKE